MAWFEWDERKARSNARKHGVRFEDAMLVLQTPSLWSSKIAWKTANFGGKLSV